jgi:hypothetical protein
MTSVFTLELGVHAPLGLVVLDDELPPHEMAAATAAARSLELRCAD